MEVIYGLFWVFAGMAFGYVLWFRDRSEDQQIRKQLSQENDDLRTSLKLAHNSHAKLDQRFTRQQGQLHVLQQLCDDWAQSREQAERERAELEARVAVASNRIEDLTDALNQEKQTRIQLEDDKHSTMQEHRSQLSDQEEKHRKQVQQLESGLQRAESDLKNTTTECQRVTEQLHAAQARVAEMESSLQSQQTLLEAATQNANGLEQEYVSLESALAENSERLNAARSECAAAKSAQQVAEESLASLQSEHESLRCELESLQSIQVDLETAQQQVDELQQSLDQTVQQLNVVAKQRDESLESEASAQGVIAGMQKRLDNQEATIHRIRGKHNETMEQLKLELQQRSELENQLDQISQELDGLLDSTVTQHATHSEAIRQLTAQRDQFADQLEETRKELSELVASHTDALRHLTAQRDQFADQARAAEAEMAELVAKHQTRIDELVVESDRKKQEYESVCQHSETLAGQCQELTELCQELEQKLESESSFRQEATDKVDAVTNQLVENRRVVELLQRERDTLIQERLEWQNEQQLLRQQQADSQNDSSDLSSQIETLRDQRDVLLNDLAETREQMLETREELRQSQQTIDQLKTQQVELETTCQRIKELEALVSESSRPDARTAEEMRVLREQYAEAYAGREELRERLESIEMDQDQRRDQVDSQQMELTALRAKLKAGEETIRTLRRERAAVLARLANHRALGEPDNSVISFTEAMAIRRQSELEYDNEYGGPVREHATRGLIYTEPPKQVDDLKRISGIAEVLEARLNDYGIYTFKQIKDWTPEAIDEFSHLLAFRDRIRRDDWMGQARQFYEEKLNTRKSYAA